MDKEFILKLLRSDNKGDRIRGIKLLIDSKEDMLMGNNTIVLENGFTIDNEIEIINEGVYNNVKIYFIGKQIFEELFEASLVIEED